MNVKRLLALVCVVVMLASLAACGEKPAEPVPAAAEPAQEAVEPAQEDAEPAQEDAEPADDTVYELRFAVGTIDLEFYTKNADRVSEATDGRVKLQMYSKDTLGTSADLWVMLQDGSLDMMENSGDEIAGIHPVQQILQIPFFTGDPTTATELLYALYDGGLMPDWTPENGISTLCFTTTDMQRMASAKKDISNPAAFNGMIWRCMADAGIQLLNSLGSTVTTVAPPDVYLSLEKGVIDGSVSSPTGMINFAYQEVCDYLLMDGLWCGCNAIVMSAKVWETLPADVQGQLQTIFRQLGEEYLQENLLNEQAAIKTMEDAGVQLIWADEDLVTAMNSFGEEYAQSYIEQMNSLAYDGQAIYDLALSVVSK